MFRTKHFSGVDMPGSGLRIPIVKAKTQDLLYLLLWGADKLMRPTYRNLTDSFEGWAYRNGFLRQLAELERRKFLERESSEKRVYRLTEAGRLQALGGRDPQAQWNRAWDGRWRLVIFDLPERNNVARVRLRRFLRDHGFGYLQKSVWISPDPLTGLLPYLRSFGDDVESLLTLEAQTCAGEGDGAIVSGAWDFKEINRLYNKSAALLNDLPAVSGRDPDGARQLQRWARLERAAWQEAVASDPLLPERLLPPGYAGREVWELRVRVLQEAAKRRGD